MKAPAEYGRGSHVHGQSTEPDQAPTLEDYRSELVRAVREHGERGARVGDPDSFRGALEAIRDAAAEIGSFNADDVAWPLRGNEVGAALAHLRRLGGIECSGYAVSKRPKAHGRLVRAWRWAVG